MGLWLLALGCGGDGVGGSQDNEILLRDYHGLQEDAAWTYRDEESDDDPEESDLLRARLVDEERVELRRGARWTEAEVVGHLEWDLSNGLDLLSWELPGFEGEDSLRMADFAPAHGDRHSSGDWVCTTNGNVAEVDTFYAVFDDLLRFECNAGEDGQPGGNWDFALGVGLVRYESGEGLVLDLVAPY